MLRWILVAVGAILVLPAALLVAPPVVALVQGPGGWDGKGVSVRIAYHGEAAEFVVGITMIGLAILGLSFSPRFRLKASDVDGSELRP